VHELVFNTCDSNMHDERIKIVYFPSLMIEVPDHVYVLFCFLTASMSVSAILVTRCAFNLLAPEFYI
jgi:hypothetical protein